MAWVRPKARRTQWSETEVKRLLRLDARGMSAERIALRLERPLSQVQEHLRISAEGRLWARRSTDAQAMDGTGRGQRGASYRLLDPLTPEEAEALGTGLALAQRLLADSPLSEALSAAIGKISKAVDRR